MNWEAVFWLIAMVVFIVVEASTVTLVSIWFAAGSIAALVVALTGGSLGFQVVVFLVVAMVMLIFLRDIVRKYIHPRIVPTNVDAIVGTTGFVTTPINNVAALGRVKLGSMEWSARSSNNSHIPEGALVKVDRVEGVKVFVSLAEAAVPAETATQ